MIREGMTAARLAEIVGVQPSAISHILSGRNYPRYDFIHNLLKAFPEMNPRWLLLGEDEIYTQSTPTPVKKTPIPQEVKINNLEQRIDFQPNDYASTPQVVPISTKKDGNKYMKSTPRAIDKVIIFYSDGTFSLYEN